MRSYLDSKDPKNAKVQLMNDDAAVTKIREYLNIHDTAYNSPIARKIIPDTISETKPNIVIVIMESMTVAKMKRFGNNNKLTPFLDSLSYNSLFFENFYSAGKHTFNGIFSTLFSFPALYRRHTMKQIRKYDGIASTLLNYGYTTTYFTTHDAQFDNVEGFLRANDFQNIVSQIDYPFSEIKTTLGVPDDYMFRYSISYINNLHKKKKPFFVAFMTASDHGPYYIPEYFHPKSDEIKQQIVEYADWSLKRFIELASKEDWYNNTIFVFVADHGAAINAKYDIAINYFHIPLIIYAPKLHLFNNKTYKMVGSQIDIYPTLMGLLNIEYINNTLGIDLLKQDRKYAIINDDDKIGIIDTAFLCIMKDYGKNITLFKYKNADKNNYYEDYYDKANEMLEFAKANLQITQKMILDKETSLNNK
jgi:phosphoglycerol transferase MdoB-like AlkP superfamily enzyme